MIKYYSFKEVSSKEVSNTELVIKNNKYLHESIYSEIKYYKDTSTNKEFISYFDKVYFEIVEHKSKPSNFELFACYFSAENQEVTDEQISSNLRGSKTLIIDKTNSYKNSDIEVIFSENGFAFVEKFGDQTIKFEKICISFLLAQAYNLYIEKLMLMVSKSYNNDELKNMIDLRKEIYIFDLKYFFHNPVNHKNQQQHKIWEVIRKLYSVEEYHKEVKSQIKDLVNLIEMDLKEKEKNEKQAEKEKEEKLYKEKQIESEKRTNRLTWIGIIFAAISIGSVYADLVQLGAVPNIFADKQIEIKK